jgi:hypothetical protein
VTSCGSTEWQGGVFRGVALFFCVPSKSCQLVASANWLFCVRWTSANWLVYTRFMAGKRNANPTRKVEFRVPLPSYAALEYLRRFGHYGGNVGEIARTLMNRELDDLRRGGVIPPNLPSE